MSNTSFYLYQRYVKYGTQDFIPVYPAEYAISGDTGQDPVIKQENDPNCGYYQPQYRWYTLPITEDFVCSGGNKYYKEVYQVSYDNGFNWENVVPEQTRQGALYEEHSDGCKKFWATYEDHSVIEYEIPCNSSYYLSHDEVTASTKPYSAMTGAGIGWCCTTIGEGAFDYCENLILVTATGNIDEILNNAFSNCINLERFETFPLKTEMAQISFEAFANCHKLKSFNSRVDGLFNIPVLTGVTQIQNACFYACYAMKNVVIPNGITMIRASAFRECSGLTSVTIPSSVTRIEGYAFGNCTSLTSITVEATTPPTLVYRAFYDTNNCPIYVPAASVETYKAASGWSDYASRIQAIP